MTPRQLAEVAQAARAECVAAVHRYPELDGFDLPRAVAEAGYEGALVVPGDVEVVFPLQSD